MNIKIAICDDEKEFAGTLLNNISHEFKKYESACEICTCSNGYDLIDICKNQSIDAVFLDIAMPEINGFSVAKRLSEIRKDIILVFVSSNEQLVFQSYEYRPFWFIPKNQLELLEIVAGKIIDKIKARELENRIILISLEKRVAEIDLKKVFYIKNDDHYVRFVYDDKRESESYRCKLDEIEKQIGKFGFIRSHRRFLVNCRAIKVIEKTNCILHNDEEIPISRSKMGDVKDKFMDYMRSMR